MSANFSAVLDLIWTWQLNTVVNWEFVELSNACMSQVPDMYFLFTSRIFLCEFPVYCTFDCKNLLHIAQRNKLSRCRTSLIQFFDSDFAVHRPSILPSKVTSRASLGGQKREMDT